jgi:translation elongation factor EF-4
MLMGDEIDTLSFMVHVERAESYGKLICRRLKEKLPR